MKNGYTLTEILVLIVFISVLLGFVGCGAVIFRGCKAVQNNGLKGVAESVWTGTNSAVGN